MTKAEMIKELAADFGADEKALNRMKKEDVQKVYDELTAKVEFVLPPKVERKESKRGRKVKEFPGMMAMVANWERLDVDGTYPLPDFEGRNYHPDLALARHHFKKYASKVNLRPGVDYTIEGHDEFGATITKKK